MNNQPIDVIATTISGSMGDWRKVERIVPLFKSLGREDVSLHVVDTHDNAREKSRELVAGGSRILISAGGSGTFNSVLVGCIESGIPLSEIMLGFLRKGSADLIGKTLGMPDDIERAIQVFVESLRLSKTEPCDVIKAYTTSDAGHQRYFVGYGGGGIFGRIPHFTENRYIKYYKGILGSLFGDLGPFFVGSSLAIVEKVLKSVVPGKRRWTITVDGEKVAEGAFQAIIIVNGYLGPDLPFAESEPLGSEKFFVYLIRDLGLLKLPGQFRHAWKASIRDDPDRWGFESYSISKSLVLQVDDERNFPINTDGSTMPCRRDVAFEIVDSIKLISA